MASNRSPSRSMMNSARSGKCRRKCLIVIVSLGKSMASKSMLKDISKSEMSIGRKMCAEVLEERPCLAFVVNIVSSDLHGTILHHDWRILFGEDLMQLPYQWLSPGREFLSLWSEMHSVVIGEIDDSYAQLVSKGLPGPT